MTQIDDRHPTSTVEMAGAIVSAYVANNNTLTSSELPNLIVCVYAALSGFTEGTAASTPIQASHKATPAEIRKSVTPGALISFIDGKGYKTLKRHLTGHGFNPRSYRERFGLPADYPMVASSYSERRSALAKAIGRGQPHTAVKAAMPNNGRRKSR